MFKNRVAFDDSDDNLKIGRHNHHHHNVQETTDKRIFITKCGTNTSERVD